MFDAKTQQLAERASASATSIAGLAASAAATDTSSHGGGSTPIGGLNRITHIPYSSTPTGFSRAQNMATAAQPEQYREKARTGSPVDTVSTAPGVAHQVAETSTPEFVNSGEPSAVVGTISMIDRRRFFVTDARTDIPDYVTAASRDAAEH
mmetsp:Transcript_16442/g.48430  ORF Transcript_16442/g.48430 Transcript_16442/m.48430 type:complete len:151 (+) Transcript_16442:627-1079(+)